MKFINSIDEVINNIKMFDRERIIHSDHAIFEQAGKYKCWYTYFDNDAGEWRFGPSKYIGYTEMNKDLYIENHAQLDGKLTEKQLVKFSSFIDDDELYKKLELKLFEDLSLVNRTPGKSIKIKEIKSGGGATMNKNYENNKHRFPDSRDCSFYILEEVDKNKVLATSILLTENELKFDLQYDGDIYNVNLEKKSPTWYCEGRAKRNGNSENIVISANVSFCDGDLIIAGLEWRENGSDYMWRVFVDQEK
ncbi:hypothetical protein CUU54_14280 [Pectobacterium polaris]|uniref:hypothetical protein n=1 Tax=Pectobacterium polaris TaxID=2042057 RepID=UPI000D6042B3|nr:hypothetical protein [Pectobacterium polaris]MCU1790005.1 hypothetical protein [Pectobacterium polaris]PWD62686.1 hypothetical protein DF209_00060 [Pectobacterium polaris]